MASISERLARVARRHTLTLTHHGRRTGRPYDVTIWFVVDGDVVWLESADVRRQWTRNVRARPDVAITIGDEPFTGTVTPVDDPATLARCIDLLADKYWFVKPLIWLWEMFDKSPLGENVDLGIRFRRILAKHVFASCGKNFKAFTFVRFSFGYNMHVGDGVVVHRHVLLDDRGGIELGDGSSVSDFANVYSHSHNIVDGRIVLAKGELLDRVADRGRGSPQGAGRKPPDLPAVLGKRAAADAGQQHDHILVVCHGSASV